MKDDSYERLPGRRLFSYWGLVIPFPFLWFFLPRYFLYRGKDYLLAVKRNMASENYRYIYYRDIVYFNSVENGNQKLILFVLFCAMLLIAIIAWNNDGLTEPGHYVMQGIFLLYLILVLIRGKARTLYVVTRAGRYRLKNVISYKEVDRLLAIIMPDISTYQKELAAKISHTSSPTDQADVVSGNENTALGSFENGKKYHGVYQGNMYLFRFIFDMLIAIGGLYVATPKGEQYFDMLIILFGVSFVLGIFSLMKSGLKTVKLPVKIFNFWSITHLAIGYVVYVILIGVQAGVQAASNAKVAPESLFSLGGVFYQRFIQSMSIYVFVISILGLIFSIIQKRVANK